METSTTCSVCDKQFKNKRTLNDHKRNVHGKQRHLCDVCGKDYSSRRVLMTHKKERHNRDNRTFACNICGKSFAAQRYVKQHVRTHKVGTGIQNV